MEKLAKKLASDIALSLEYDKEKEAVIAYGLFGIFQIFLTTAMIILLGFIIGAPIEATILCFSVSLLKKYSGGVHVNTPGMCVFISAFICTLFAAASKWLLAGIYHPTPMLIAIVVIYLLSFVIIFKNVPVDSPNKPITSETKIRRMRRGSFTLITFYFLLSGLFYILSFNRKEFGTYGISMLFGVAWQVFTLTTPGTLFMNGINHFISLLRKEDQK